MLIIAVVLVGALLWFVIIFNRLIRNKNLVREAWSGIDVQLKRRYELIPNLVEVVKGYSRHEQRLFEEIAHIRSNSMRVQGMGEKKDNENALSHAIGSLLAVSENYPELKANQNFLELQRSLTETEDQLQLARRYYNGTVRNYNIQVESFPNNLIANMRGFKREDFFEIELATQRINPEVNL